MFLLSAPAANSALRRVIKRLPLPQEILLVCLRWRAAFPLSLRKLEETGPQ